MPNYTYSDDPYSVIKNKFHTLTHDELQKLEEPIVAARYIEILSGGGPEGRFDVEHLKAIHKHLFQDIYEWAGHTRNEQVHLSDGTVATEPLLRKVGGDLFMVAPLMSEALASIAERLRQGDYLRGFPRQEFAESAADILADINAVHPFREGNGRTQRVFVELLALQAGHELDFSVVSKERMIEASIAANDRGDNAMMRRMFDEISNPVRVAAMTAAIASLEQQGFPWNDRYLSTMQPGQTVEVTMAGIAGTRFMARTGSGILIGQAADLPLPHPARGDTFVVDPSAWPEPTAGAAAVAPQTKQAAKDVQVLAALVREHDRQRETLAQRHASDAEYQALEKRQREERQRLDILQAKRDAARAQESGKEP